MYYVSLRLDIYIYAFTFSEIGYLGQYIAQ